MSKQTIIHYFEETVKRFPDKSAICLKEEWLTYSRLKSRARSIATQILRHPGSKDKPVAIAMGKTPECFAAMLGVLYSGNPYAILDIRSPKERISRILDTLNPGLILADKKGEGLIRSCERGGSFHVIKVEDTLQLESDEKLIAGVQKRTVDTDPAYILFTSGSTGVPKGSVVGNLSVIAYASSVIRTFSLDENTVFGSQTPFYFSMSVLDIFVTILTGATLVIIPKMLFSFPLRLFEYMKEHQVNTLYWVPTAMEMVADRGLFKEFDGSFLKTVLFAGEPLPPKYLNIWRDALPEALFANLYGPTEVTDTCTYYVCTERIDESSSIPIGKSFDNCDVFLLNEEDQKIPVSSDAEGEICVRGAFLAYGYYNDPEQTSRAFVRNPLNAAYEEKIYRTGDLGKWSSEGDLIYCGRKDHQIKHMGYRIELGEIENVMGQAAGIQVAVALYDDLKDDIFLAFTGSASEEEAFRSACELLPSYMRPAGAVRLEAFPINANGKIDRKKLKAMLAGGTK